MVARWLAGEFELVVSQRLLSELERAVGYPKLRARVTASEAAELDSLLRVGAILAPDPPSGAHHSVDPGDDYLLALAEHERAVLVSGDQHLLVLADRLPVQSARPFLDMLVPRP
jgi:predicted nucleic acid-binding protein